MAGEADRASSIGGPNSVSLRFTLLGFCVILHPIIVRSFQGPLVNEAQFNKVTSMVDEALSKGAKLVSGGSKHHIGDLQYKPTILTEVTTDMSLVAEEVFGPVISIKKFETEEVRLLLKMFFSISAQTKCYTM